MHVILTPQLEAFVRAEVEAGRYASADEVLREAVRLLHRRERLFDEKLRTLRQALVDGEESGLAEDSSLEGLLAELDVEIAAK